MSYYTSKGSAGGDRPVSIEAKLDQVLRAIVGQTKKMSALDKKVEESFTMLSELSSKVKVIDDRVNELQTICETPAAKRISQSVKVPCKRALGMKLLHACIVYNVYIIPFLTD